MSDLKRTQFGRPHGRGLWVFLVLSALAIPAFAREIRLGILPLAPVAQPAADLLTAGLTGRTNIALVERAEIDKIYREQNLAANQRANLVKLGQLLNAEGLFILQPVANGTNQLLEVRLVAVQTGVALGSARYPLPLQNVAEWSRLAADRFGG